MHQKKDNHGPFQCPVSFLIAPPTATVRSSVKDNYIILWIVKTNSLMCFIIALKNSLKHTLGYLLPNSRIDLSRLAH